MNFYDVNGEVAQGPTTSGWAAFAEWAEEREDLDEVLALIEEGETESPEDLVTELENVGEIDDDQLEEIRQAVLAAARKADGVLILSD